MTSSLVRARRRIKDLAVQRPFSIPFEVAFKIRQLQDRALPGALIIGGQKCGTTSIYNYLLQHPQMAGIVERPDRRIGRWIEKEVHFFNQRGDIQQDESWYRAHFERRREGVINFESTPNYLVSAHAPSRARAIVPNAKLIVSLRDPVDRAFSAYHHMRRQNLRRPNAPQETFREFLTRKLDPALAHRAAPTDWDILQVGHYAEGFERWFAHYPREQFHIIDFRNLVDQTSDTVEGIIEFLGLPPAPIDTERTFNEGRYEERMDPDLEERLREYFEPHNRRLEALLGYSMGW
jgi:hypothetical protein